MKTKLFPLLFTVVSMLMTACGQKATSVVFTEGPLDPETGAGTYTITVNNPPEDAGWIIWCSAFRTVAKVQEGSNGDFLFVSGSLHKIVPTGDYDDKVTINFTAQPMPRQSWAPEKFTLDVPGKKPVELKATYEFQPVAEVADFSYNKVEVAVQDIIPAVKSCTPAEGSFRIKENMSYADVLEAFPPVYVESAKAGWYRLTIKDGVSIEASDGDGAFYAAVTLVNMARNGKGEVPNMVIEDWPDLQHRGMMLDVARNFTSKDNVLKFIDLLAHFKVNVLHLHLADDEAWRLEMPGMPQFTAFAAFHSLPARTGDGGFIELEHLQPSYSGDFLPDAEGPSNGFYTKEDYIEILKYAKANHIRVIPEVDTPGHFRAALRGMDYYCDQTGDESYRLTEAADTSKYMSVQHYNDNAMNIALEGSYKFMEKLFDTLIEYYAEASAELPEIHIGGDEVPGGAWTGSPACKALMEEKGWTDVNDLKSYFIDRVLDIAEARGVKIDGWQEIPARLHPDTEARLIRNLGRTNVWSTWEAGRKDELSYQFANKGIKVVLCNMTNAYSDFAYNRSKLERGLDWGGIVDERRAYSMLPFSVYKSVRWDDDGNIKDISKASDGKTVLEAKENILGVQGQLWSETIRNFDNVTYYIFPKMLGLWERGWNASPVWEGTDKSDDPLFMESFDKFYSVVTAHEFPYFEQMGICYRKRD